MKRLTYRVLALTLALLLVLGTLPQLASALGSGQDPRVRLGAFSGDMLSGGGMQVQTDRGLFYIKDADGYIYHNGSGNAPVYPHRAARLNYADGVLYFARLTDAGFDLCSFDLSTGTERVLLEGFSGTPGQIYLVDGDRLDFLWDGAVWELMLKTGEYRMLLKVPGLWSFVPTGRGLVYAVGSLFDYDLYAGGNLLVRGTDSYYVDFSIQQGVLVFSRNGQDFQVDLGAAFDGTAQAAAFRGEVPSLSQNLLSLSAALRRDNVQPNEAEAAGEMDVLNADILDEEGNRPQELEPAVDNLVPEEVPLAPEEWENDPQAPETGPEESAPAPVDPEPAPTEPAPTPVEPETDPTEPAPVPPETEPTEPAPVPPETEPTDPAPMPPETEPTDPTPVPPETAPEEPGPAPVDPRPVPIEPDPSLPLTPDDPEPVSPAPYEPQPLEPDRPTEPTDPTDPTGQEDPTPTTIQPDPTPWTIADPVVGQPAVIPAGTGTDYEGMRRPASEGVQNIVRRARQMTGIRWTPRQNVVGWRGSYVYQAGVTYTGLPYGQPVDASYVPWNTGLSEFIAKVNNINSPMYTSYSNFGGARAPYYSVDCSGFVTWAWGLPSRNTTWTIGNYAIQVSSTSYANIQVGDALNNVTSHVVLVTDVTYDEQGAITSIEISESTPTASYYGCCRSTRFSGATGLAAFRNNYLGRGYVILRSKTRDNVSYTHECVAPLAEDNCPLCSNGMFLRRGVDVSQWQGVIDWQTAAPYLTFAIIRTGYGLKADSQYDNNVRGCLDNKLPYGIYLYALATTPAEAVKEAQFVLSRLGGRAPDLPIFYDVEELEGNLALPNDELLAVVTAFCSTIEAAGYDAGVYCSTFFWNYKLPDATYNNWCRWVAQHGASCSCINGANLWQCTDNGYVPGINTNVDLNYWFGPVGETEHRYRSVSTDPTCTEPGGVGFACVECGLMVAKTIPALGHRFEDGICAVCGVEESAVHSFADVNASDWYAEAVEFVTSRGLFNGVSGTSFAPNLAMNRGMMVTVLWRLAGQPETEVEELFNDVSGNAYYAVPVTWAAHLGVVNGTSLMTFSPSQNITREQAATFLYRFAGQLGIDRSASADLSDFPDGDAVSDFARSALSWAVAEGLITGSATVDGRVLLPKSEASRAQIAAILMRFVNYLETKAQPLSVGIRLGVDAETLGEEERIRRQLQELLESWTVENPEFGGEVPEGLGEPSGGLVSR